MRDAWKGRRCNTSTTTTTRTSGAGSSGIIVHGDAMTLRTTVTLPPLDLGCGAMKACANATRQQAGTSTRRPIMIFCYDCGTTVEVKEKKVQTTSVCETPQKTFKESFGDRLLNEIHAFTRLLFSLYIFYALVYSLFSACNHLINF